MNLWTKGKRMIKQGLDFVDDYSEDVAKGLSIKQLGSRGERYGLNKKFK